MPNPNEKLSLMHCTQVNKKSTQLSDDETKSLIKRLPGWVITTKADESCLEKNFMFKDFSQAMAFTNQIAQEAEKEDHHPSILTEWAQVTVSWWTHTVKGLHLNDFIMAAKTDELYGNKEGSRDKD